MRTQHAGLHWLLLEYQLLDVICAMCVLMCQTKSSLQPLYVFFSFSIVAGGEVVVGPLAVLFLFWRMPPAGGPGSESLHKLLLI